MALSFSATGNLETVLTGWVSTVRRPMPGVSYLTLTPDYYARLDESDRSKFLSELQSVLDQHWNIQPITPQGESIEIAEQFGTLRRYLRTIVARNEPTCGPWIEIGQPSWPPE